APLKGTLDVWIHVANSCTCMRHFRLAPNVYWIQRWAFSFSLAFTNEILVSFFSSA
ncbi:unnamed protein product, partial [Onchocerca ochengi]|uniref:Ovule protein n=1 Tax=Onchocerca ochengi TaxID=42157 RepID=A0A182EM24_ONCOC